MGGRRGSARRASGAHGAHGASRAALGVGCMHGRAAARGVRALAPPRAAGECFQCGRSPPARRRGAGRRRRSASGDLCRSPPRSAAARSRGSGAPRPPCAASGAAQGPRPRRAATRVRRRPRRGAAGAAEHRPPRRSRLATPAFGPAAGGPQLPFIWRIQARGCTGSCSNRSRAMCRHSDGFTHAGYDEVYVRRFDGLQNAWPPEAQEAA